MSISVLAPIAIAFESLVSARISIHSESNSLFAQQQFGFIKNLSCEHVLNLMVDEFDLMTDKHLTPLTMSCC